MWHRGSAGANGGHGLHLHELIVVAKHAGGQKRAWHLDCRWLMTGIFIASPMSFVQRDLTLDSARLWYTAVLPQPSLPLGRVGA
ncbi:hypothetical protein CGQ24_17615 [Arthrobacter sp. 7749]|nr:hypothetical protein CGQ24_17615 [Arthrobacter sp. 7749]